MLRSPAMNRGSDRIRRWSGIDVWMPSTTNILRAPLHPVNGFHAILAMYDQLRNQRIIVGRHLPLPHRRLYPRELRCLPVDSGQ